MSSEGPILIVDDSMAARHMMRKQLEAENYDVIEAESGEEALSILSDKTISLVTLDIEMPRLDGFETCRLLRSMKDETTPNDVPVIFLTGSDNLEERIKGFEVGACDFLNKQSISSGELIVTANRYLRSDKILAGHRALIVEDTKLIRVMLDKTLRAMGADTRRCADGQEAYEVLAKEGSSFDVIILDHKMPKMTGLELCAKIRRELGLRTTPVLFLSGTQDREEQLEFFKVGASDYLVKPFIREELEARLRVHIEASKRARQMSALNAELDKSNRALEQFASVAAHDLKSPLLTMKLSIEMLKDEFTKDLDPTALQLLGTVSRGATRMNNLIEGLLSYSRISAAKMELANIDLNETLAQVLEDLKANIEEGRATVEIDGALPVISGSPSLIRQAFQNLIGNSLKYVRAGVPAEIKISCTDGTDLERSGIEISIQDNGIGFDSSQAEQIFGLFSRLVGSGEFEGSGIGLSTVKRIIEAHSGTISAEGRPGEGATFTIFLPEECIVQNESELALEDNLA